jgi:hypothetical protein
LAVATYHLLERPIRRSRSIAVAVALAVASAALGAVGLAAWSGAIQPRSAADPQLDKIKRAIGEWEFPAKLKVRIFQDSEFFERGDGIEPRVLFLGDSVMQQYAPRVEQLIAENPDTKRVIFAALGGCAPIPNVKTNTYCEQFIPAVRALVQASQLDTIVVAAQWHGYFDNGSPYVDGNYSSSLRNPEGKRRALLAFKEMLTEFRSQGRKVVLVLNSPTDPDLDPKQMIKRNPWSGRFERSIRHPDARFLRETYAPVMDDLRTIAAEVGATVVDPMASLCSETVCPATTEDGEPIYNDGLHIRPSFARYQLRYLDEFLR